MEVETRYARSGDLWLAYQVIGDGPVDLVWAPGTLSGSFAVQFGAIVPASEGVETLTFGYARRLTVTLTCLAWKHSLSTISAKAPTCAGALSEA